MFETLIGSIQAGFSNLLPHDFCVPCFLKGLAEGIGFGALTIGALALVATFAAPIAGAVALIVAVVGVVGLLYMAANWKNMDDRQKSEALGGLAGGALVGGTSGGMEIPMTALEPVLQPGGAAAMELVATQVAVSPTVASAVGAGIGGSGAAMMAGDEGRRSDEEEKRPLTAEEEGRLERARDFYREQGWPEKRIEDHLAGIDPSKPVEVVELKKGTIVGQYQGAGDPQGNYYGEPGADPNTSGIPPDKNIEKFYRVKRPVKVLKSTAADIPAWDGSGRVYKGGSEQVFTPETDAFEPLPEDIE